MLASSGPKWRQKLGATFLFSCACACASGCGRTRADELSASSADGCETHAGLTDAPAAPVETLPARLEGTLCGDGDSLWMAFEGSSSDAGRRTFSAQLVSGEAAYAYTVRLYGIDAGEPRPLPAYASSAFELEASEPEYVFAVEDNDFSDTTLIVEVTGPAGPVAVELAGLELPPYVSCSGHYESLPPKTPARALPTLIETELCHARDTRTWAVELAAARQVTVTLENPLSIDGFDLDAYRSDVDGYEPLPVSSGATRVNLGLFNERQMRFTPRAAGVAYLYASLGNSRAITPRLRIEQAK